MGKCRASSASLLPLSLSLALPPSLGAPPREVASYTKEKVSLPSMDVSRQETLFVLLLLSSPVLEKSRAASLTDPRSFLHRNV